MAGLLDALARWLGGGALPDPAAPPPSPPAPKLSVDDPRLPSASRDRMARLIALLADIAAHGAEEPGAAQARVEARQISEVHVPQLIASYAEIPAAHRAELFRRTGRSASYDLNAGLDRIIARLEQVSRALAQADIDSFSDNLRFIEHRYGRDDPLG